MKKNGNIQFILVSILFVALVLCGTVFAYMFRTTAFKKNDFTPAEVACEVIEKTDSPLTQKEEIQVKNTGLIDSYLRLRLVTYWVDSEGNVVSKPSAPLNITLADGWIKGNNDTYYWTSPVQKDKSTGNLLAAPLILSEEDGYLQVVEVFAEAIQAKPQNAVTQSWGVTLNSDGIITGFN